MHVSIPHAPRVACLVFATGIGLSLAAVAAAQPVAVRYEQSVSGSRAAPGENERPRARDLGIAPGVLPPGPLNAITDVPGVRVGHVTLIEGKRSAPE